MSILYQIRIAFFTRWVFADGLQREVFHLLWRFGKWLSNMNERKRIACRRKKWTESEEEDDEP